MPSIWTGSGSWQGWSLTTNHSASRSGEPVLVSPSGKAYGPGEIERPVWSIGKERFGQSDLATALGVSREYVGKLQRQDKLPPFDGHLASGRGWWSYESVCEIIKLRQLG